MRRIDVRNDEILIGGFGSDGGTKEIVVVFAIQECSEVDAAVLAKNGEGETLRGSATGKRRCCRKDALGRLVIADQPIDAFSGEGRINARAVEFDGVRRRWEPAGATCQEKRLLDSFGVKMQRARVGVAIEARGKKPGKGDAIPAFLSDRDFNGLVIGNAERWDAWPWNGETWLQNPQSWGGIGGRRRDGGGALAAEQLRGTRRGKRSGDPGRRRFEVSRTMSAARAIDVHVFNPVRGTANGMRVNPAINLGGMLWPPTAKKESRPCDERRIKARPAGSILAIDMEAEVAGLLMGAPFENDGTIGLREGLEGGDVHSGGRLNGGDGTHCEWVIRDVGSGSGSRACDGGSVGGEAGGAKRGGCDVDGDDRGAADGKVAEGASHGSRARAGAHGCVVRVGDIGDLGWEGVRYLDVLRDGGTGVGNGDGVGECRA